MWCIDETAIAYESILDTKQDKYLLFTYVLLVEQLL